MQKDFLDVLRALSAENAEYLVVGGYALAAHGHVRATGDIDVWVGHDPANAKRVYAGLTRFGAPLSRIQPKDFAEPDVVFQMGIVPNRVDILTSIDGVEFNDAWAHRILGDYQGLTYPVIGLEHLKANKKASGRPKDLQDLAILEGQ
jgi:hypothetical protein